MILKGSLTMNDNQKERLLKIAETNPELAKEMMDFMKEEKQSSQEPIAVKMVKAEDDKIEITEDQKQKSIIAISLFILSILFLIFALLHVFINSNPNTATFLTALGMSVLFGVFADLIVAKSIGFPLVKKLASKHFKIVN